MKDIEQADLDTLEIQENDESSQAPQMPTAPSLKSRLIMSIAIAAMTALTPACKSDTSKDKPDITLPKREKNEMWDGDKEYFRTVKKGCFSKEEYQKRLKKLPNGETVFEDIGALTFYRVEKGDSIVGIRAKLSKYKQFAHLKTDSRVKTKSFNVPQKSLIPGMLIPIPLDEKDRTMTDEQFVHYANDAIDEMLKDSRYGEMVEKIIKKTSKKELIMAMISIAKQESGGSVVGQLELHRWEPHHKAFSFSLFHILMKNVGMKARQNLNMTEGQLYHPKNGAKVFLAYLCEKTRRRKSCYPEKFFPLMKNINSFTRSYNGTAWRKNNPNYIRNVRRYYAKAKKMFGGKEAKRKSSTKARKAVAPKRVATKRPEARGNLKTICKKVNGRRCSLNAKRFNTNKRLLDAADASRVSGADKLKKYYCNRIKYLLEGQRSGKFMRPKRNWSKTYRKRKKYINKKCGR